MINDNNQTPKPVWNGVYIENASLNESTATQSAARVALITKEENKLKDETLFDQILSTFKFTNQ